MTKSKTIATALAALTLATTFTAFSGEAQARPRWGWGLGAGLAAGTLIGIAAANSAYAPGYSCHLEDRIDRWGNLRTVKVCVDY
jgi:hypothetical protein